MSGTRLPDAQFTARSSATRRTLLGRRGHFTGRYIFPDVMAAGGFDVALGNPPWERIKLQEQEFFASRDPEIAQAPNAAVRGQLIKKLENAASESREHALFKEFETAR